MTFLAYCNMAELAAAETPARGRETLHKVCLTHSNMAKLAAVNSSSGRLWYVFHNSGSSSDSLCINAYQRPAYIAKNPFGAVVTRVKVRSTCRDSTLIADWLSEQRPDPSSIPAQDTRAVPRKKHAFTNVTRPSRPLPLIGILSREAITNDQDQLGISVL